MYIVQMMPILVVVFASPLQLVTGVLRRYRHQPDHVRGPVRAAPHRAGAGHGDQAHPQGHRPGAVRGAPVGRLLGRQVTPDTC